MEIPRMFRGNCQCGRWLMIPYNTPKESPIQCECGRKYHGVPSEKKIYCIPGKFMPALCLDLDGTVRYSKSGEFINSPGDVALFFNVEQKIWQFREKGYLILGISNQGGIAFGYKTALEHDAIVKATIEAFDRNPFHILKFAFHHPEGTVEPYCHRSLCRKPDIGMLALCEVEAFDNGFVIDWDNSIFVGDREEDRECASRAGIRFIHANEFFGRST